MESTLVSITWIAAGLRDPRGSRIVAAHARRPRPRLRPAGLAILLALAACKVKDLPRSSRATSTASTATRSAPTTTRPAAATPGGRRAEREGRPQPPAVAGQEAPAATSGSSSTPGRPRSAATSRSRCSATAARSTPTAARYMATGYELIFGGWYNSEVDHRAARRARQRRRAANATLKVQPNQHYHWRIERNGKTLTWYVDDMTKPFLVLEDPQPARGSRPRVFRLQQLGDGYLVRQPRDHAALS